MLGGGLHKDVLTGLYYDGGDWANAVYVGLVCHPWIRCCIGVVGSMAWQRDRLNIDGGTGVVKGVVLAKAVTLYRLCAEGISVIIARQ